MRLHRYITCCEFSAFMLGVVPEFAQMTEEDIQIDCIPPTVPCGSVMFFEDEWDSAISLFGEVHIIVEVPEEHIIWRGRGRYTYIKGTGDKYFEYRDEVSVIDFDPSWIVEYDTEYLDFPEERILDNCSAYCDYCFEYQGKYV